MKLLSIGGGSLVLMSLVGCGATPSSSEENVVSVSKAAKAASPFFMNVSVDCYWCNAPTFVNLVQAAEQWRVDWQTDYDPSLIELDANGWPTELNLDPGSVARSILGPPLRHGTYHVTWKGKGTFNLFSEPNQWDLQVVSTGNGSRTVEVPDDCWVVLDIIETNSSDHLRDFVVVHEDFLATYQTEPYYPESLAYLDDYAGVRLMGFTATNDSEQVQWSDRVTPTYYSQSVLGASWEHAARLCNQLQSDCWINVPHQANDAYVQNLATLLRDSVNPNLKIYLEYSNETWNGIFTQHRYVIDNPSAQGLPGDDFERGVRYTALRSAQIYQIFANVFGSQMGQRVVRVGAGQAGNSWVGEVQLDSVAPSDRPDVFAIAPYFGGASADGYERQALSWSVNDLIARLESVDVPEARTHMQANYDMTSERGIELIAYEGGQHLFLWGAFTDDERDQLNALYWEARRDPRMYDLYSTNYTDWRQVGGHLFAVFSSMGETWGIKEYMNQPDSAAPRYRATRDFASANPRWW